MQGISESKGTCCSKGCCSSSICLCFNLWYFIQSAQICPGYIKRQKNNMWGPAGPILQVTLVSGVSSYIAFILQRHVCKANAETTRNPFFSTHHHFTCRMNPQPMKTSRRYMTRCSVQCQSVYIFFYLSVASMELGFTNCDLNNNAFAQDSRRLKVSKNTPEACNQYILYTYSIYF